MTANFSDVLLTFWTSLWVADFEDAIELGSFRANKCQLVLVKLQNTQYKHLVLSNSYLHLKVNK